MTFREASAWITLLVSLALYGWYFLDVGEDVIGGGAPGEGWMGRLVETVIAIVVLEIVLTAIVAGRAGKAAHAPQDERERAAGLQATAVAYWVLLTGVISAAVLVGIVGGLVSTGRMGWDEAVFWGMNALLLVLVLSEAAKSGVQIFQLRRTA